MVRKRLQFILKQTATKTNHLIIIGVTHFWAGGGGASEPTRSLSSLQEMDLIMHWNVWIHGSDVTNVIFYSLYLSVVLPCQCVFDLVGFTCHEISEDRLARPFWKYLNIFSYFVPVDGNLCYGSSGTNSLGELWLVMSNTLQMFQSHFEKTKKQKKNYIIGPRLAARTYEVIFICSPAGRFLFCYLSFFFV